MGALRQYIHKRISPDHYTLLDEIPNDVDIKEALFSIYSNKSLGPDGFNSLFFKETWDVTGPLIIWDVKEFFVTGELLKESNETIISLIPKMPNPFKMGDFRPISCCNTIYKCISKIISKRLQMVLPSLIDPS